ncbi:MAG: hypothetical protein GY805_02480 [Chloroflexi bacterium]|nr:hypothetical protein [Chloroflexota bacterium]
MNFKNGVSPNIDRFLQIRTYYGLIEGVPDFEINANILKNDKIEARRLLGIEAIHQINPTQRKRISSSGRELYFLPKVKCIVELSYHKPTKDESKECSRLGLIWYQDKFAFSVNEKIIQSINDLDWEQLSIDDYW